MTGWLFVPHHRECLLLTEPPKHPEQALRGETAAWGSWRSSAGSVSPAGSPHFPLSPPGAPHSHHGARITLSPRNGMSAGLCATMNEPLELLWGRAGVCVSHTAAVRGNPWKALLLQSCSQERMGSVAEFASSSLQCCCQGLFIELQIHV